VIKIVPSPLGRQKPPIPINKRVFDRPGLYLPIQRRMAEFSSEHDRPGSTAR